MIFNLITNDLCYVFEAENQTEADKYAKEIAEGKDYQLFPIKGIQIQHEILFQLAKEFRDLTFSEAEKNGINKHLEK